MENQPNIKGLNLEEVKVKLTSQKIKVNQKLQITNTKLYTCGSTLGGYKTSNIAKYKASIAMENLLFFPGFKINYSHFSCVTFTKLTLSTVGLTETEVRLQNTTNIIVIEEYLKISYKA